MRITFVGGPTALLELGGVRLLTDPTFDPAGSDYPTPIYTLHKITGPAIRAEAIGTLDAVLLSHDHHFDNLDRAGRAMLATVERVFTTQVGRSAWGMER
jgi:L-ascorbate metabolism protein UlaG (beta-lactamase superfamily)